MKSTVESYWPYKISYELKSSRKIVCSFLHVIASLIPSQNWDSSQPKNNISTDDVNRTIKSYASLLLDSFKTKSLSQGKIVHSHLLITGLHQHILLESKLAAMYAICGKMVEARQLFDKMSERDVFLWNTMIRGYTYIGTSKEALRLYYQMQDAGVRADNFTFNFVLKACALLSDLEEGKEIHDHIIRNGFESDLFVGNALIFMYSKCGCVEIARQLFDNMPERDVISWNTTIAAYAQNGFASEALTLFHQMIIGDVKPDPVSTVSALQACASLEALREGKGIHNLIIKNRFELVDVSVGNSLIALYSKCGMIDIAFKVFDKMKKRNLVSWNSLIAGYAQNGRAGEALKLFHQMQRENLKPNQVTIVSISRACADLAILREGKEIHNYIIQNGFESDITVANSLIAMYAKCRCLDIGRQLFEKMSERNVISWNIMIAGYAQNGQADESLFIFHEMQFSAIKPHAVTMISVIFVCARLASLQQGSCFHAYIIKCGFDSNDILETTLIDMYAKCGRVDFALQTFQKMSCKNVVAWTAMISAYARHGLPEDALALFAQMVNAGIKPDHVTFTHILSACTHAGLVDEGWKNFECMSRNYGIIPRVDHYACMVDLLGRAGRLDEAELLVTNMPLEPNAGVWGALLSACRIHGNIELGERAAKYLFKLEPEDAGNYILLSNMYAAAGRWYDAARIRTMMNDRGLKKTPGCSLIEVNNKVHSFLVGDRSHPEYEKIYAYLQTLNRKMKEAGYAIDPNFALHNMEEGQGT
ncbi:pentatricopeptide repeat-containing protein At5g39350 [Cryptomeria japonica]|uniref:pentatricopeptide repeat-containing protein At5g39350 n=1 Tax=Cryptomeria japonica TaxID=3369 RepID=UPI0027DA6FDD|nr:pentatricopeptide repeat-containing protein At5g39350 [Cryptomeria japonica]